MSSKVAFAVAVILMILHSCW